MCNNEREKMGTRIREIPEDIEWPRYYDGELVDIGHIMEQGMVVGIELRTEGYHIECLHGSFEGPYGACVIRPALAADGEIVREGETVWNAATGEEFKVVDVRGGYVYLGKNGSPHVSLKRLAGALTHKRPVLDADGAPIYEGDTLYGVKTGRPCKVRDVVANDLGGRVLVEFDAPEMVAGFRTLFAPPSLLTHERPVFDADDVPIRPGDVVYANAGASGDGTAWRVRSLDPGLAHSVKAERADGSNPALVRDLVPKWLTHEPDTWERNLVRRCKRLAERGEAEKAPAMPEGIEWPRWDDGELVTVVPPFRYDGRQACKLCYDGGVWFLLDTYGDVFHSIHRGETLERSKWGVCR